MTCYKNHNQTKSNFHFILWCREHLRFGRCSAQMLLHSGIPCMTGSPWNDEYPERIHANLCSKWKKVLFFFQEHPEKLFFLPSLWKFLLWIYLIIHMNFLLQCICLSNHIARCRCTGAVSLPVRLINFISFCRLMSANHWFVLKIRFDEEMNERNWGVRGGSVRWYFKPIVLNQQRRRLISSYLGAAGRIRQAFNTSSIILL